MSWPADTMRRPSPLVQSLPHPGTCWDHAHTNMPCAHAYSEFAVHVENPVSLYSTSSVCFGEWCWQLQCVFELFEAVNKDIKTFVISSDKCEWVLLAVLWLGLFPQHSSPVWLSPRPVTSDILRTTSEGEQSSLSLQKDKKESHRCSSWRGSTDSEIQCHLPTEMATVLQSDWIFMRTELNIHAWLQQDAPY